MPLPYQHIPYAVPLCQLSRTCTQFRTSAAVSSINSAIWLPRWCARCSQAEGKPLPAAAGSKSIKARQNEAVAAADAAATYSLRSVERGRVEPAAAASTRVQHKPALPADWGFLK